MDLPAELRDDLERINRLLVTQRTMPAKLEAIAEILERTVPGCDSVSISLVVEESAVTGAASSQLAIEADLVQYGHDQGPCLTAAKDQSPVRIDVLQDDERFEHFAPGAIEKGVESVLSIPLLFEGTTVGSINLYSETPNAFTAEVTEQIAPFAEYAVEVIAHSPLYAASLDMVAGLVEVVDDAAQVEIAVGVLIFLRGMDQREAWEFLQRQAADTCSSLVETARHVMATRSSDSRDPSLRDRDDAG